MPRRIVVVLVVLLGAGLGAPAQAAITASNVTAPADGAYYLITDASPATTVAVTGTSNGTTGDAVDVRCYTRSDLWSTAASNVPVAVDGSFSTTMSTESPYGSCVLRAVPHNFPATSDPSPFTGPAVTGEQNISYKVASGPNAGTVFDIYVLFQGVSAMNDYISATRGGLWDSRLQYSPGDSSRYLWYENAALEGSEPGANRSYLQIDGRNAFGPASAFYLFGGSANNPGLPGLTYDAGRDTATGDTTIHETDPIVVCPDNTFPPTALTCPQFNSAGVQLERTYFTDDGGRQVHITDTWRSTDNAAHTLSLHYDQWVQNNGPVGLELPWVDGFQTFTSDTTFPGPSPGPGGLFVADNNSAPDGSAEFPRGAISFDVAPNAVRWRTNQNFTLYDESFSVPAGGTAVTREDFVIGQTQAEVEAKAAANVDRFIPPSVAISSPADGSTAQAPTISVSGTATDNVGVSSLTVNGQSVSVGSGGAWSTSVSLKVGQNQITAVAKDAAGNSSQAQVSVTYPQPAVTISRPKSGRTTHNVRQTLSGTASANVSSLTVKGKKVSLRSGGSWSTTVSLSVGRNKIKAVGKDSAGNAGQAQITVTYPKPKLKLRAPKTTLSKLLKSGKLKVKATANDVVTGTLIATVKGAGKRAAFRKAKVKFSKPGTKTVKLKLIKAGRKALAGEREAKVIITAKAKDRVGHKAKKKLALTLKR